MLTGAGRTTIAAARNGRRFFGGKAARRVRLFFARTGALRVITRSAAPDWARSKRGTAAVINKRLIAIFTNNLA